ncbi:hypothetical protein JRA31_003045, partial [Acinetobacter baumannii]
KNHTYIFSQSFKNVYFWLFKWLINCAILFGKQKEAARREVDANNKKNHVNQIRLAKKYSFRLDISLKSKKE